MKKMRMMALTLAALLAAVSLCGCGFTKEREGATLEISMDNSWRSTELEDVKNGYNPVQTWGNCILLSKYDGQRTFQERYQFINTETGEVKDFTAKAAEDRTAASNSIECGMVIEYTDGNVGLVMNETSRYEEGCIRRCIEIYDADMNYLRTEEIPADFHNGGYLDGYVDNQGNWYLGTMDQDTGVYSFCSYNSNYEKYGEIPLPAECYIYDMVWGREDGTMYACMQHRDGSEDYFETFVINGAERTIESTGVFNSIEGMEKFMSTNMINYYDSTDFVEGSGEYDFCFMDIKGLYGYRDGEETLLLSWINSDFPVGEVSECYYMDNGSVLAVTGHHAKHDYYLCTPRTQEEIENTKLISLSSLGLYSALESAVIDYNKAENGWRIIVVDYNQYNTQEDKTLGAQKLQEDMLDGVVADLVCTDGMHFESLAGKGIFADWYDLMDADESFSREDYLQNFFHAYEYDGKLQRLAVQYSVHSAAAKTELAGEHEGASLAEYSALMDDLPAEIDFYDFYNREWFMKQYFPLYMNAFVDAKNAECYFDSGEFARILDMLAVLPTIDEIDRIPEGDLEKRLPSYHDSWMAFQDNRAFIEDVVFKQPIDYRAMNRTTFRDAPVTMVGIPMNYDEGNGGLFRADFTVSVNAQSDEQEAIWNFMKHLLEEEYQRSLTMSLPVHLGALDAKLDETKQMVSAKVPFGMGESFIGESNDEEMAAFRSYLEGIQTAFYYNDTVYTIMMEEIDKYLAGDQDAQECGRMIQSRVTIYLSEQS